ncbi:hypothetical protein H8R17_40455, partial [Streptomyces sp. TRM68367]|nr:hypothetical protein [Streptomyces sp. TRM68367]
AMTDGLSRPSPRAQAIYRTPDPNSRQNLVAQIDFTEWTRDGILRHPRYLGVRDDKKPQDVVRESGAA